MRRNDIMQHKDTELCAVRVSFLLLKSAAANNRAHGLLPSQSLMHLRRLLLAGCFLSLLSLSALTLTLNSAVSSSPKDPGRRGGEATETPAVDVAEPDEREVLPSATHFPLSTPL
jgi:hypothetical protein